MRRSLVLLSMVLAAGGFASSATAAPFTAGNLVVYRVGDGAVALTSNGTAVFLDEYTTAGVLVQSIAVPTTTVGLQRRLVASGTATTEGFLTRSTDGQSVVFSGYDAATGTASITTSTSATVPRVIGRVVDNGTIDTTTALTDAISGGNPRSAASTNGTDLWLSGTSSGGGVRYATLGATTSTSLATTPTNLRVLGIFGGQLYTSSQSGAFRLATVGSGTPTASGQTITNLPGFPTATGSPQAYFFADLDVGVAGVDTVYVADDGGTIQKYSLVSGSWTANGTIALTTARGITGTVSGSTVTLYVTARTTVRTLTDTSGYNATITGTVTTLATAATNTAIQGVAFVPQAAGATPTLNIDDVTLNEGDSGTTTFTFHVTLTAPAGPGGVTFDIATADGTAQDGNPGGEDNDYVAQSLTGQSIGAGSTGPYNFSVTVNGDTTAEPNETFFVNVTNITGANAGDTQAQGTITNDDVAQVKIHDVQGNGALTPMSGATVSVEGVVTANFQGSDKLQGFFLQEEDADTDADPATSEGIFVFCGSCTTPVAEGQRVRATGTVSEFNNMTQITASSAGSVVVTDAGNHLAEVTPSPIDLPIAGDVNTFYEALEGMKVTFVDALTVSEYFQLGRFGQIILFEGSRPRQFTEANPPSVAGNNAQIDNLSRRRVILDDDDNGQESYLSLPNGSQFVFYPRANGGFSVGTQGTDFFRGGDLVNGLTGVLHWSFPGFGPETWRLRPTAAEPATFTVADPRPATPPAVGGAIKVVGMNLLNYFTTIDTTASNNTGPCAPSMTLDCRGADSVAELNRQRERASVVVCGLNADLYAFMELENTTPSNTITDLLGAINARCGGAHPYDFVNTGGTLGTDAIRVQEIYRTGILSPVGSPLSDLDPVHNRPPTAQTFDVVDPANPALGERFTVIANHFKSKGCPGSGGDADAGDGQGCFNATRTAQATRLLAWITGTVLPAAGDPDVLLLGDFNSYAKEDPVTALSGGGFDDLETTFHGANAYSYLFDGQLGHLDYGFASSSLLAQVTGTDAWHINADEVDLFDYNDEIFDSPGEASFEEKPDGSSLVPPRVVFQPASPYRASDHDPVLVGLFPIADLSITKAESDDPVAAGTNLAYTITVTNSGPDAAANASWSDTLPSG
ncbi:MAG TPA: ExeM/NucH family extracellular endonuclease, partial [Thermoanaerobaculia bacterium]|nr:ExeM/NucH family extracellular endonuclease [Thermoanaerobaculia bacterium]